MPLFLHYEIKFPGWESHGLNERNPDVPHSSIDDLAPLLNQSSTFC
jgi:hypothetical protein